MNKLIISKDKVKLVRSAQRTIARLQKVQDQLFDEVAREVNATSELDQDCLCDYLYNAAPNWVEFEK